MSIDDPDQNEIWMRDWLHGVHLAQRMLLDPVTTAEERAAIYTKFPGMHPDWPTNLTDELLDFAFVSVIAEPEMHKKIDLEYDRRGRKRPES